MFFAQYKDEMDNEWIQISTLYETPEKAMKICNKRHIWRNESYRIVADDQRETIHYISYPPHSKKLKWTAL